MKAVKVKGNTYCIDVGAAYIPFYKINEKDIILFDTGSLHERKTLESVLEENDFNVKAVINSHTHPDHVASNQYLKEKYNCIIAAPMFEAQICGSAMNLKTNYSGSTLTEVKEIYGYMLFKTDIYIDDTQNEIKICGVNFKIMHTPGHSPSHICITTPDNVSYVADTLVSYEMIESYKLPYDYVLLEDLKSKDRLYGLDCCKYIVAHKGIYDDITNLIADNIAFYIHRAEKTCELINEKMTIEEIIIAASKSFGVKIDNIYKYDTISKMIKCQLDYLCETGRITLAMDKGLRKYERNEDIEIVS